MNLHIDLQDGFQNDEVIVRLNGKQVFHKTGVSTDIRISRADGIETPSTAEDSIVEVELPAKHVKASEKVKAATPNVGISLRDGRPQFRVQSEVFLYM